MKNAVKASTQCILTLELLVKQKQLVSQDKYGEIKFWLINRYELTHHRTISTSVISFCKVVLHKSNMLLCNSDKSKVNFYSVDTYDKCNVFNPHDDRLGNLMVMKSIEDCVFCGYEANVIVVWCEDRIIDSYNFPELECLMTLDVDRNVTKGICGGSSDTINTFRISDNKLSFDKSIKITNPGISVLQLRPDDKIVAAACWDLTVRLFSWKNMKLLVVLETHSTGILNIAYSELSVTFWKAKYMLAVATKDSKIILWDVYNKKEENILNCSPIDND